MKEGSAPGGTLVHVPAAAVTLEGMLRIPPGALGVVLFAHGSGSSRFSPRNQYVADELVAGGLGTLLIDLLTHEEEEFDRQTRYLRFDIGLLATRLVAAIDWLDDNAGTAGMRVGLFGSSTGGGAAIVAATARPDRVAAVVSRGGRPDLADEALSLVEAPTLLLVGGDDGPVIALNRQARERVAMAETSLQIIPRATHLFEEPGALEQVAHLARAWFVKYLSAACPSTDGLRADG
jgi:putative phosphoribosyl transferase